MELYREYIRESVFELVSNSKQKIILGEIGHDQIDTATSFVDYLYEKYGFSKSCVWYNLKKMKRKGMVEFAERGEEQRPLELTKEGLFALRGLASKRIVAPLVIAP